MKPCRVFQQPAKVQASPGREDRSVRVFERRGLHAPPCHFDSTPRRAHHGAGGITGGSVSARGRVRRLASGPGDPGGAQPAENAKTWIGRATAVEEYMRTAPIVRFEDVSRGVTRPRRGYFAPGGPVESIVWKALRPGMSRGFYESYTSEIAVYQDRQAACPRYGATEGGEAPRERHRCGRHVDRCDAGASLTSAACRNHHRRSWPRGTDRLSGPRCSRT